MYSVTKSRTLRSVSDRTLWDSITGSSYFVEKLKLDRKLEVHNGCVNTVCWNDSGTLLLSGSDDQHLVVSDPFNGKIVTKLRSGHRSNIFCARFLPGTYDREVVSCSGSGDIFYTDLDREDHLDAYRFGCHFGTTYKVVVVPNEASTFLSCGDDGTVRFFDLRVKTSCSKMNCEEDVIVNLQNSVSSMAVDPVIPYQLAVGSADGIVRIYDRRMLKAREKGGNPKSLICVFQSPMSKTEKRHFRITSLNYRPGSHDVLVNYSSENIYLFNTYDMETTQKYSVEQLPKATANRKPPTLQEAASLGGSTENEEMEDYLGFSPEERRGPSTLYRPIRRLRLRGDWSDTGPNARPDNEGQAPTSMIMQRMSDLLTRMLNTHVNEPSAESTRGQENPSNSPAAATGNSGITTNDMSASGVNPAVRNSTPLSIVQRQSEDRQSISSEGLVSPELSSLDSSALDHGAEGPNQTSDGNPESVSSAGQEKNLHHFDEGKKEVDSGSGQTHHRFIETNEDNASCREDSSHDHHIPIVPLENNQQVLESLCQGGLNLEESQSVKSDKVDIIHRKEQSSNNDIFPSLSVSLDKTRKGREKFPESEEKTMHSGSEGKVVNLELGGAEFVNVCDQCGGSSMTCEYKSCPVMKGKEQILTSSSCSIKSQNPAQSALSVSAWCTDDSDSIALSGTLSSGETLAIATSSLPCLGSENSNATLDDVTNLASSASLSSLSGMSTSSQSLRSNQGVKNMRNTAVISNTSAINRQAVGTAQQQRHFFQESLEDTPLSLNSGNPSCSGVSTKDRLNNDTKVSESCRKRESLSTDESISTSHALKPVEEENMTEYNSDEGQRACDSLTSGKHQRGAGLEERLNTDSSRQQAISFVPSEEKSCKSYPGKGKGVGKSSRKTQEGEWASAPYNDGNMKFAVLEKIDSKSKKSSNDTDENVAAPSYETALSSDGSNQASGTRARVDNDDDDNSMRDEARPKTLLSCTCDAVSSTSRVAGEFSGALQPELPADRQRRAGYSLPPTGNFQLHSDDDHEDEDNDEEATRVKRSQQSKSHAARKIQELFRKRRHAKEHARLLNLPQPKVHMKFSGHRNCRTMIKESNFYGDKYVMSGSDCGRIFIWERETGRLAMYLEADKHVVNCVQPNPHLAVIASSGIDYDIKLWAPLADESQFDEDVAHMIVQRNELMLVETRDTITVPPALMLRVLASLSHLRAGRTAASASQQNPESEQQQ